MFDRRRFKSASPCDGPRCRDLEQTFSSRCQITRAPLSKRGRRNLLRGRKTDQPSRWKSVEPARPPAAPSARGRMNRTNRLAKTKRSLVEPARPPAAPSARGRTNRTSRPAKPNGVWWSQTGSNRRPPACKAGALPTELWPRRNSLKTVRHALKMVGPGRLELPTSRLSGVRSNHLSYGPPIPYAGCPSGRSRWPFALEASAKKEKRRRRCPANLACLFRGEAMYI